MTLEKQIRNAYEKAYGVKTVDYEGEISKEKNTIAVEICEDGTVFEHEKGGVSYVKIII